MSMKKQLLDPLGTLCKLAALNFSELHTKISIHDHILTLHRPDSYQSMIRLINGDSKENVSELFYAIMRVVKWYLSEPVVNSKPKSEQFPSKPMSDRSSDESEEYDVFGGSPSNNSPPINSPPVNNFNPEPILNNIGDEKWVAISKSQEIRRIVMYACDALRKLQETYEYGNVILAIQFYINILEDAVDGRFTDRKLPKYIIKKEQEYFNLLDYDKLKNFWDYKKLKMICELYDTCFSVYQDTEMPESEKTALVAGSMHTINSILKLTDTDFQKLIQNSSKG